MADIDSPTKDELRSLERAERLIREGVRGDTGLIAAMILEAVYEARDDEHSRRMELEANNERLRAALQMIISMHPDDVAAEIARRALESKDE